MLWFDLVAAGGAGSVPIRLDPVEPSGAFDALMAKADAGKYPKPYRYMAYRVHAAGRSLAEPVHYDGRPETDAMKVRYADWLKGG